MQNHHINNQNDSELARKIRDRIKWDKRVSLADLDIVLRDGVIVVSGYVDTSFKKIAALEVISETEGVWTIEDRIVVPTDYYRSDEELQEILETEIAEMVKIGGEHIEVLVTNSVVRLEGEVFRPRLKATAVGAAWELSGVHDVINAIEIMEPPRRVPLTVGFEVEVLFPLDKGAEILEDQQKEVS